MRTLAIDTIERQGSLAVLSSQQDDCELVKEVALPESKRSARTLVPQIDLLLKDCSWKIKDLDLITVATGPGSFTGLRIGVTVAKALAFSIGAELVGVHSLSALGVELGAESKQEQDRRLWTVLDAQRQELFAAAFLSPGEAFRSQSPETRLIAIDEWLELLEPGDIVTGPPLKDLAERIPNGVGIADSQHWSPTARAIGKLGVELFQCNGGTDPMQLVPNYYRKSAAEEKADATA